jgi:hypothetical protein
MSTSMSSDPIITRESARYQRKSFHNLWVCTRKLVTDKRLSGVRPDVTKLPKLAAPPGSTSLISRDSNSHDRFRVVMQFGNG